MITKEDVFTLDDAELHLGANAIDVDSIVDLSAVFEDAEFTILDLQTANVSFRECTDSFNRGHNPLSQNECVSFRSVQLSLLEKMGPARRNILRPTSRFSAFSAMLPVDKALQ